MRFCEIIKSFSRKRKNTNHERNCVMLNKVSKKSDINEVWRNIQRHSGETFKTVKGILYDFHVEGEYIKLHNTNWSIPKKDVENALLINEPTVSKFQKSGFQGPSYLYGIITDNRIKN